VKILLVNKFHYIRGGCESYYFGLASLLQQNGHQVAFFSMQDDRNEECAQSGYFARHVEFVGAKGLRNKATAAFTTVYSLDAKKKLTQLIDGFQPDVIHLHNFHRQLSCSVIDAAHRRKIPLVFTAHDCTSFCPQITMSRDGKLCNICAGGNSWNCFTHKCIKGSASMSFGGALEAYVFYLLGEAKKIDAVIVPSEALAKQYEAAGFPKERLNVVRNFTDPKNLQPTYSENGYFLYFGRLSEEKGLPTLLGAIEMTKDIRLKIAGTGPMQDWVISRISEQSLADRVEYCGFQSGQALRELIGNAYCSILPSECFENCPMSVIESMLLGKPVIASNIGGIPELVQDGVTGLLFQSGSSHELADCIISMKRFARQAADMGKTARQIAMDRFTPESHYEQILQIYSSAAANGSCT
jgi:glycosyltransferase involved in cell wall biosynthesis